jgi:protein-S-isoprenylcysteine O-methyltransferase Ste14
MAVLIAGGAGLLLFVGGVALLGVWLRMQPSRELAERTSRIAHFLFFACLGLPVLVSLVWPGLTRLDPLLGLPPLPLMPLRLAAAAVLLIPGLYFMGASNVALRALGSGANAFRLTERVVHANVFELTRNPMSLGYYLLCLAIALLSGSTLLTLYVVAGLIPAHLFFLLFFEARELELRFGDSYREYRARVPFLLPRLGRRHEETFFQNRPS